MDVAVRIFANSYYHELVLLHSTGEFQKSVDLIPIIEKQQEIYDEKISKEMEVLLAYNKAYSYFGVGNYKRALQNLNDVLNDNEQNLRQDVYSFARLFNLVIHYELENYDFLDYVIKSTNRYLSKHDRDYEIENVCIKHIRKLAKTPTAVNRMEIFERMHEDITRLLEDHNERVVLEYFNISAWVDSKIHKCTFEEAVRKSLIQSV